MSDNLEFRRADFDPRAINVDEVPVSLRCLIPFAERVIQDGPMNSEFILDRLPEAKWYELQAALKNHLTELAQWLDESQEAGPPYPSCHAAFSGLRMYAEMSR